VGTQSLLDLDWDWKNDGVFTPADKGMFSLMIISLSLTFIVTHIILSGESNERVLDLQPLSPVPPNEVDVAVTTLKSHKHLFEATVSRAGTIPVALYPGKKDFCCLFQAKVPVSISL
jgi:hypothetical protein